MKEEIANMQKKNFKDISPDVIAVFRETSEKLAKSGLVENSLKKGDNAPDFSLPDVHGNRVSLKELLKKGLVVISFERGSWCPYCNLEVVALQRIYPEIKKLGAELIAISPSLPEKFSEMESKHSLSFELLSDRGNTIAKKFGLVFKLDESLRPIYEQWGIKLPEHNGDESYELPFPATYIVNQDEEIVYSFVNSDYIKRAEPEDILNALREMKAD